MRRTHHKDFAEFKSPNPEKLQLRAAMLRKKNLVRKQGLERIT